MRGKNENIKLVKKLFESLKEHEKFKYFRTVVRNQAKEHQEIESIFIASDVYYSCIILCFACYMKMWAGIAQSAQGLATDWMIQGSNPGGGGEVFRTHPDSSWGPPSLIYNGYRVFPGGVKWLGHGVDHPPASRDEVKKIVELYLCSPFGPSWPVLG